MCCPTWISSTMTKRLSSRYCLCPWMWTTIPLTTDVAVTLTFVLVHSAPCISMKQNIHDLQKMDDLILVSKIALGRQPRLTWGQETQAVGIMGQPPVTSPQGILSLLGLTRKSFTFEKQKLSSPPEHPGSRSVFLASCFTLRTKATVQGHTMSQSTEWGKEEQTAPQQGQIELLSYPTLPERSRQTIHVLHW